MPVFQSRSLIRLLIVAICISATAPRAYAEDEFDAFETLIRFTPLISSLAETNDKQIEMATDMVRNSGGKRVGFLGLAFKPGTDDLRESPILEVINSLIEEGYDISAYDPAINADTRVDNQFSYVRNVCPHLEPVVNALPNLLTDDPLAMIDQCDVVVVTQGGSDIREMVGARLGRTKIIDLVRLFKAAPEVSDYNGIGW